MNELSPATAQLLSEGKRLHDEIMDTVRRINEMNERLSELLRRAKEDRAYARSQAFRDQNGVLMHDGEIYTIDEYEAARRASWEGHEDEA
jgi:cell division protein FtsB